MSTLQETSATQEAQALSEKEPTVNRKYKDTVFRMLFSEKKHLLSLYNAVTGKHYEDAEALQIVTLKNAIYMGMKNDLAFLLETNIYLYEHQSTVNPNMPLRNLLYIAIEYQKYVSDKSLYSSSLLKIPAPKFVVFYNGTDTLEDTVELKLSSAYEHLDGEPDLELKVILLNINEGHNKELMEHCRVLKEYAIYVARVRKYAAEMKLEDAVNKAIEECIKEGVLADFLQKNRSEVKMWSILEYDQEVEEKKLRKAEYQAGLEAGLETGRSEGITIGKNQGIEIGEVRILQSIQKSGYPPEKIAEMTGRPVEEVKRILKVMP